MSPNGRRAWRKWCKRARLRMNKHHRALYRGAIMRKKQPERTPLPVKPFTARSLVGMTMGARKRLYQRIVDAFPTEGDAFLIDTEGKGVPIGWLLSRRLRPCPGCEECRGYDDGLGVIHCDGSGVMPARKQR